jgi:glycosyltransferase involved in cell wall biosynthesis
VQDPSALLVHVTDFNRLMWDSGETPSTVVEHGVAVPDAVDRVVEHARRLVLDREEAAALSASSRQTAKERFGIERFAADWSAVLQAQAGRRPLPHRR